MVSENKKKSRYEMDMTRGSILKQIILFAFPLMMSSMLQLLFNAADVVIVGRFNGEQALAAVGSTSALINLIINLFVGMSVGANVIIARYYAAKQYDTMSDAIHTSITLSLCAGFGLMIFGFVFSKTFLIRMGSPEDVLPLSTLYLKIYFLGMPANMLYNFSAAVLRSVGDTRRPLYFLAIAGCINVALNLFFVIVMDMSVAGVALATILSQLIAAMLVMLCLLRSKTNVRVDVKKLRFHAARLKEILGIGLPAGLQSCCFSLSNVLIQSTINSFGTIAVAANAASLNLEGFVYISMNAFHQAAVTMTSQNLGAMKCRRIRRIAVLASVAVVCWGIFFGGLCCVLGETLLGIYSQKAEVIQMGMDRVRIIMPTYFICGIMDVLCGCLRGLGQTVTPMLVSIMGACVFRIIWIYCIMLPFNPTLDFLYLSYPASWIVTSLVHFVFVRRAFAKLPREDL